MPLRVKTALSGVIYVPECVYASVLLFLIRGTADLANGSFAFGLVVSVLDSNRMA